jgi:hypothetical protein
MEIINLDLKIINAEKPKSKELEIKMLWNLTQNIQNL